MWLSGPPIPDQLFSENLVVPGIEPGPMDLLPGTLPTRPQRRSGLQIMAEKMLFHSIVNHSNRYTEAAVILPFVYPHVFSLKALSHFFSDIYSKHAHTRGGGGGVIKGSEAQNIVRTT
jgi:hypothetical protein